MRQIVRCDDGRRLSRWTCDYFRHHREKIDYEWESGCADGRARFTRRRWRSCWGRARKPDEPLEQRHKDIARSVQAMYEEAFFHLLERAARAAQARTRLRSPAAAA